MYPYAVAFGLTLYDIFLCAGIIACFLVFSRLLDVHKVGRKVQFFATLCGAVSVVLGYFSAVLFQALYNIKSLGRFEITQTTGATFYGGLVGGIVVFLALFFGLGSFMFKDKEHARFFFAIADSAMPGIALAHSLGRVGCFFAGCCHGAVTDLWFGIEMWGDMGFQKYIPVQLFEAVFLLLLSGFLCLQSISRRGLCLSLYLSIYAVWRFIAEFIRGDYRGDTVIEALSPSQLIALLTLLIGIAFIFVERYLVKRYSLRGEEGNDEAVK